MDVKAAPTNQLSLVNSLNLNCIQLYARKDDTSIYYQGKQVVPIWVPSQSPNPICDEIAHVVSPTNVYITFQS